MTARYRFTILGCGASTGVPRIGGDWGACDPHEPKNRRRRASLLVERFADNGDRTVVVIDTGPDFREQMLMAGIGWADGVVYTHAHADHIHGIDDLRAFVHNRRKRVMIYADETTSARLHEGFGYCFKTPPGSNYPPILDETRIRAGQRFTIDGPGGPIELLPYRQIHGDIDSLGFRIGDVAYSSDVSDIPAETVVHLQGLDTWIVDALRPKPHPSHFSVYQSIDCALKLKVKHAILTHMHADLDYVEISRELPKFATVGYDGMTIEALM
ncbi:putative hydrolase [Hartmannibacter diazotrophicus]|uniref:Putative hydrolase n=1 Tax=Hartmannibacter diazotrophicus TaxID=1482074 RepID=A0A2C9D6K3_9HYPH|nr:MBL fold metallo-hydrolase [Hartmannibacter diazotrophicus]SON55926.1 putative hydrolase [Hartmannibacter diazotrophicus]